MNVPITAASSSTLPHLETEIRPCVSPQIKAIALLIGQVAIRSIFILSTILIAAISLPPAYYGAALPLTAISAGWLAAFFFQENNPELTRQAMPPLPLLIDKRHNIPPIDLAVSMPPHIPPDAPRGLERVGNNCCFNANIHFIEGDPVSKWVRNMLPKENEIEPFCTLLKNYQIKEEHIASFRDDAKMHPDQPIRELLKEFLKKIPSLKDFSTQFETLCVLDEPFANFFAEYDQSLRENRAVARGNSQVLREALSKCPGLGRFKAGAQEDAHEILSFILMNRPDNEREMIEEATYYTVGEHPIESIPDGIQRKESRFDFLSLPIEGETPTLSGLLQNYCNEIGGSIRANHISTDGEMRSYLAHKREFRFAKPPSTLRFHLKRFNGVRQKITTSVEIPEIIHVPLKENREHHLKLSQFVIHTGESIESGHYIAGRKVGENYYLINDNRVTLVDQEAWYNQAKQAYLLTYLAPPQ